MQESKYRLVHSSGTPDVSWKIYQGNHHVGNVGKDLNVTITTDLKTTRANMESILDRAKWEVVQSQSHTSIFTKRLADNLIRLGFTVQHFWQQFQMHLGIHKNDRLVATVDPHDKITFQPEVKQADRRQITAAQENAKASLQSDYEQHVKEAARNPAVTESSNAKPQVEQQPGYETWSERATPENAPDNPGVPSDDISAYLPEQAAPEKPQPGAEQIAQEKPEPQPQAAAKSSSTLDLTDKEKLFMLGLLCSPQCKELAEKYDMSDQIKGIVDKINESSPHLTRQARESEPPPQTVEDELDQMEM